MTEVAQMKLRIKEKATRRTWMAYWPPIDGVMLCCSTGSKRLIVNRAGFSEYNDDGEPVLDSWLEPVQYVRISA